MRVETRLEKTCDYIANIERAADVLELEAALLGVGSQYGMTSIFGGFVPDTGASPYEIDARILVQKQPLEWAQRYSNRGYIFRDPIVHRLQVDRNAFSWADGYESCPISNDVNLIKGEASEFGLRDGVVIPVTLLDGSVSAISFGGDHVEVDEQGRSALSFAANFAVGKLLQQRSTQEKGTSDLTPREFDCLLWAAEGKTDWEVSVILGISKSTVVKHLLAARDKLGAVNKAHAIAMALREKLIR